MPALTPLLARRRYVGIKTESTPGTAVALAAADATLICFEPKFEQTIAMMHRERPGGFGELAAIAGPRAAKVSFMHELSGSLNAGTPKPAWATTLFPACGLTASSNTFVPNPDPPEKSGATTKTLTCGLWLDGKLRRAAGCMGNVRIMFVAGETVKLAFEFDGLFEDETAVALPAPTLETITPLRFNGTCTLGSVPLKVKSLEINLGATVYLREAPTASGYCGAVITDRLVTAKLDPEQWLIADNDVFTAWLAGTAAALSIVCGGTAGNIVTFGAPKFRYINVQDGERSKLATHDMDAQCDPDSGNDEFTIAFS